MPLQSDHIVLYRNSLGNNKFLIITSQVRTVIAYMLTDNLKFAIDDARQNSLKVDRQ